MASWTLTVDQPTTRRLRRGGERTRQGSSTRHTSTFCGKKQRATNYGAGDCRRGRGCIHTFDLRALFRPSDARPCGRRPCLCAGIGAGCRSECRCRPAHPARRRSEALSRHLRAVVLPLWQARFPRFQDRPEELAARTRTQHGPRRPRGWSCAVRAGNFHTRRPKRSAASCLAAWEHPDRFRELGKAAREPSACRSRRLAPGGSVAIRRMLPAIGPDPPRSTPSTYAVDGDAARMPAGVGSRQVCPPLPDPRWPLPRSSIRADARPRRSLLREATCRSSLGIHDLDHRMNDTGSVGQTCSDLGARQLGPNTSKALALGESSLPAPVARRRFGLVPAPHPMGDELPSDSERYPKNAQPLLFQEVHNGAWQVRQSTP